MLVPSPPRIGILPVTESVVLPPNPKASIMTHIPGPACPKCQTETIPSRISFDVSGFDFRTFECPACEYLHKAPVALVDPMK
jgi:hypothetical protein